MEVLDIVIMSVINVLYSPQTKHFIGHRQMKMPVGEPKNLTSTDSNID